MNRKFSLGDLVMWTDTKELGICLGMTSMNGIKIIFDYPKDTSLRFVDGENAIIVFDLDGELSWTYTKNCHLTRIGSLSNE